MRPKIAIILPTLNRGNDLLVTAVKPIINQFKYIEKLIIIDNGHQNIKIEDNKALTIITKENLGVAGSWNLGIKYAFENFPEVTHVVACQDDCAFGVTQIPEILDVIEHHEDKWFMVGAYYWAVWAISREGAKKMAYDTDKVFDDHFFPAYFEDNDFHWRIRQIDESKYMGNVSAMAPEICVNSGTLEKDPTINSTFDDLKLYYIKKWGGGPGLEKYKTPFNR